VLSEVAPLITARIPGLLPTIICQLDTLQAALLTTRGGMQLRWKVEGYNSPPRPSGTSRNLLGFKDGTANPTGSQAQSLIWVDDPPNPPGPRAAATRWCD
jgi:deferrochelatase/peroxidase EfeB